MYYHIYCTPIVGCGEGAGWVGDLCNRKNKLKDKFSSIDYENQPSNNNAQFTYTR